MIGDERKKLTEYPSIDNPQSMNATYFERNPIIPNLNIYLMLKLLRSNDLDKPAVDCLDLKASYRMLLNDCITISLALKELSVKKGDIVSISMPNFYQAVSVFLACNRIGAVATFLDPHASDSEINNYLNLFESPIFFNYNKGYKYNQEITNNTKVKYVITLDKQDICSQRIKSKITGSENMIDFSLLWNIAKLRKYKFEPLHLKKENALILFTSGSTGKPKSVVLTNENVLAAEIYLKNTSQREKITGCKTLNCVPFSYPYGLITSTLTTLLWGKEAILCPNIDKNNIGYFYRKRPNIIFGSPALLDLTMNNISQNEDLSSVTHFISGGDFLTFEKVKRGKNFFYEHGAKDVEIGNGSGNAETVSVGTTPVGVPLRQDTAGKLLVGINAMVVDPDTMEEKKYGEEGMLCISGKLVFKEYYKNTELTQAVKFFRNGKQYFKTGTMGIIDKMGYFKITARQSRFYITSSLNKVYCDNVQNIISTFAPVKDCVVVKVPDKEQLYVNKAYIILNNNYDESTELIEHIKFLFTQPSIAANGEKVQLKSYEIPTYVEFIPELPRIPGSEKINFRLLEQDAIDKISKSKVVYECRDKNNG